MTNYAAARTPAVVAGNTMRIKSKRRPDLPQPIRIAPDGRENESGLECHYIRAPFRFCVNCGVAYGYRQSSDFAKLTSLGTEGRSTATTILSLAAIRYLRADHSLSERARKLLSFTDNRQDASLQAGHFNDFIEIGLLRSALHRAIASAGPEGVTHELLVEKTFAALDLPLDLYAADPTVRLQALDDTKRALRNVFGYRLYRDLELAVLDYTEEGDTLVILHVGVPHEFRGQGVAGATTKAGLGYAKSKSLRVIPLCSYAAAYIRRHPQYAELKN